MATLRAGNAAGSLRGVIEKKYYNHEARETFFYHWCEDRNLGNPLFKVDYLKENEMVFNTGLTNLG